MCIVFEGFLYNSARPMPDVWVRSIFLESARPLIADILTKSDTFSIQIKLKYLDLIPVSQFYSQARKFKQIQVTF